ncbi:dienelactone hydrolase family protein [Streptomyces sp. NPDC052773]|jgi:dienelactone hydrolase|uniref:dienelactone hydrolase family protein n=1 Tax=Streptomyces sp. NPDC052773 TaxID=3365693 RepID=UPI0037D1C33D
MTSETVTVPAHEVALAGDLTVPGADVPAVVLFAHGSGSSRHSPRNQAVAAELNRVGLGTLLLDLLSEREEHEDARSGRHRFDIGLLAGRLVDTIDWLERQGGKRGWGEDLPVGLFGASTGAAAALVAAAERPRRVYAVVSRGGRPDLAGEWLPRVEAPVLLIVGGADELVLGLNEEAAARLAAPHRIHVVPGATHLFPEPGALEEVATAAGDWFRERLGTGAQGA